MRAYAEYVNTYNGWRILLALQPALNRWIHRRLAAQARFDLQRQGQEVTGLEALHQLLPRPLIRRALDAIA